MIIRSQGRRGATRAVFITAALLTAVLAISMPLAGASVAIASGTVTWVDAARASGPVWEPVKVQGVNGVVTEFLWNSRQQVAAAGYVEPGAGQGSLAVVRNGTAFVLAKARVDGIIGWSVDETLLAYIISSKEGRPLLCLYNPVSRTLDFNDLPQKVTGKARGGAWDASGRLLIYTDDALFVRQGTGEWEERPFPAGFAILAEPRFTSAFSGGTGTLLLGTASGRLALWDIESDKVTRGPQVAGVRTGGVNSRGNRVWTIRRGHPWRLDLYDLDWRSLGHRDGLIIPEAVASVHGWRLYFLARTRRQTTLWAWNLADRRQSAVGPTPSVTGPIGLRISDDGSRLFILTGANHAILETPVPPE